jgi:hypothetical protein
LCVCATVWEAYLAKETVDITLHSADGCEYVWV